MRIDLSDESFRAVEAAVHIIMDAYGERRADIAHEEYTNGDLFFMRHLHTIVVRYKGQEVLHTYLPGEGKDVPSIILANG
jgi:hypothetical protein